jgi:general secretion pathway protein C
MGITFAVLLVRDAHNNFAFATGTTREKGGFKLIGTVCSNDEKFSLAIIENSKDNNQSVYRRGSQLPDGAKIKSIFPDHILVEKGGQKKVITITGGSDFNQKELISSGYQKISSNEWIVNPNRLFKSAMDVATLCGDLEVEKAIEGFEIKDIGDNAILEKLGLQEGDILKELNGNKFDSLYAALDYLWYLEDGESVNIKIIRNKTEQSLVFYPNYDELPSYVESGSITPRRISSMLTAKHEYAVTNVVFK